MIVNINHQLKDGTLKLLDTRENQNIYSPLENWMSNLKRKFPLPEGAKWLVTDDLGGIFEWKDEFIN
jgi:hypothetical protein